jgi:ankyrin repeat protein
MYAADFDAPRFRDGLVALLKEEKKQPSDDSSDESSDDDIYTPVFTFSAEWGDLEIVKELLKNGAGLHIKGYDQQTALMKASASGNIEIVRLLLEYKSDINTITEDGWTALALAAAEGHSDICQLLLDNGALLEIEDAVSVLHVAAENGHVPTCRLLIEAGVDVDVTVDFNSTPLGTAAKKGHLPACKLLLDFGANINHKDENENSILFLAISSGNLELVQYLMADRTGLTLQVGDKTPLIMAAQKNKTNILKWLLAEGAPVNQADKNNHTALMAACSGGTVEAVSLLLQHGAKMDMTNNAGMTPLFLAVSNYNAGIVELLIKNGVPLFSDRHEGFKALTLAVEKYSVDIASLLLNAGVPVEPVRFIGNSRSPSLLNIAIQSYDEWPIVEILELLLKNRASTSGIDANGDNALMLATKLRMIRVIDLLGKYGAQIGQINQQGQNALQIATQALDLSVADSEPPEDIATNAELVVSLLKIMQTQPDWAKLREEALNRAQRPLTRELILLAWAWKNTDAAVIGNLAETNIQLKTIQDLISLIITSTPADFSRKKIEYMLSMAGVCPPLIEKIYPYIEALPLIKKELTRHPLNFNPLLLNAFLGGAFAMLETIRTEHGENWMPYGDPGGSTPLFKTLNQIANLELTQLIEVGVATEQFYTIPIFENLFETCFNLAGTAQNPFATLPAYSAVDGDLTLALVDKGVYFMLATRIEKAWKKAWAEIVISQESNRASSSSSSSQSAEAAILPDITSSIDTDTADMDSAWIEEMILPDASSFPDSPQGLALLQAFRNALRIAFNTPGESILDLKDASPTAAQIYASLMHRQLHMLNQFIEARGGK